MHAQRSLSCQERSSSHRQRYISMYTTILQSVSVVMCAWLGFRQEHASL